MTSMELLELMGQVNDRYVQEAHSNVVPYKHRMPLKRRVVIALVAALMLMLVGCAWVIMKLQDLKVGDYSYTSPEIPGVSEQQTITKDLLSMQGYVDSVNYQAAKEWREFLNSYDTDGALLANAKTDDYQESIEYMAYQCYTREMQDKIDEICDKYGLEVLGSMYTEKYTIDVIKAVGIDNLFADKAGFPTTLYDGYCYRGGTFSLGGETTLYYEESPWIYPITYQYRCVMKNAFDEVCLPVDDMESFEEWNYTLQDGTKVLLALSSEKALIIVDKEEFFVTINVLNPRVGDVLYGEQQMDRAGLEAFAETFTFDYVPQKPDLDILVESEWFTENANVGTEQIQQATDSEAYTEEYVTLKVYEYFLSGDRMFLEDSQADMWWIPDFLDDTLEYEYTYLDLDGDGLVELLVQMKDNPGGYNAVFHYEDGKLYCWNSDAVEMSSWDYPLSDGTMVHQYDYNGTSSYTIFRYNSDGERENVTEVISEEMLEELVVSKVIEREEWMQIPSR